MSIALQMDKNALIRVAASLLEKESSIFFNEAPDIGQKLCSDTPEKQEGIFQQMHEWLPNGKVYFD